jgi:transcription antitermination factor NusG
MLTSDILETPQVLDPFAEEAPGSWYLLRTKSRQEKVIASDLYARGVLHFLPLMLAVRYYGNKKAVVELPLFPGYVFLRGSLDDAYALDRAGRIAQIMPIGDQRKVNWELKNIAFALSHEAEVFQYPYLHKGVRVEVRSGPFRGLQGMVEDRLKRDRLILQVDILGRAVSLEVDGALLDVID